MNWLDELKEYIKNIPEEDVKLIQEMYSDNDSPDDEITMEDYLEYMEKLNKET